MGFGFYKSVFSQEAKKVRPFQSDTVFVYNITEDKVIKAYNAGKKRPPASLVKVMTTYLALDMDVPLDTITPVDPDSFYTAFNHNASMAGYSENETVTLRDLLYGTMLPSGAEAANSIAVNLLGSKEAYVRAMNKKAKELGMKETHFTNVDGIDDPDQYTTAKDMAKLMLKAIEDEEFFTIMTSPSYQSTPTDWHPEGVLMYSTVLTKIDPNLIEGNGKILGGKSGTTGGAGLCWMTLAQKNGKFYLIVVMGAPLGDINQPNQGQIEDTINILNNL